MNKKVLTLTVATIILIFLRCSFNENEQLMYVITGINIVSTVYVIYTILERVSSAIENRIKATRTPKDVLEREIKNTRNKKNIISMIVIIGMIAFWLWGRTSLSNDILSIITLWISIIDEELVNIIAENYKI